LRTGPYELLDKIGAGGMGAVYRGRHSGTGQIVAVKLMTEATAGNPILLRRFEQEYEIARRLTHPHLVHPFDFGMEGSQPYLVMEFVDGPNLGQRVRQEGPLPEALAIALTVQVASALQAAHDSRLIHRDVKPDNVLIGADGAAKLADLGLIKDLDSTAILTRPRAWLGTIGYTAPEQFEDASLVDARCDIYALAATLYYALTGAAPFAGRGALTILQKKLTNDFLPPSKLVPTIRASLDTVICRTLEANPAQRPSSCKEFAELLLADGAGVETHTRPDATNATNRRRAQRHASSLAVLCRLPQAEGSRAAEVQDVSLNGVCLQLNHPVEVGGQLALESIDQNTSREALLRARIRWLRKGPSGKWRIGCEFERLLTPCELETLIGVQNPTVAMSV